MSTPPQSPIFTAHQTEIERRKVFAKEKIRKRLTDGGIVKGSGQGKNMSRPKWIVKKHCGVGGQSDRSIGGPSDDGKRLPTTKRGQHTKVLADRAHNEMTLTRPPKKGGIVEWKWSNLIGFSFVLHTEMACYYCVNVSDNDVCNRFAIERPCPTGKYKQLSGLLITHISSFFSLFLTYDPCRFDRLLHAARDGRTGQIGGSHETVRH